LGELAELDPMIVWPFFLAAAQAFLRASEAGLRTRCSHKTGEPLRCNLILLKTYKTGSSTASGVARRIAAHNGLSGYTTDAWSSVEPLVAGDHASMAKLWPKLQRLHLPSFVFSMVREPVSRCLSHFYHGQVYMRKVPNTAAKKLEFLRACKNMQIDYMNSHDTGRDFSDGCVRGGLAGKRDVDAVMAAFDFVGVTEDFDTSMGVLAAQLGVPPSDVLYLSAKVAGEQARTPIPHPPLEEEPASVQAFVRGEFRQGNADFELWETAKQRLRAQASGVDVASFQSLLARATKQCAQTNFPTKSAGGGLKSGCYWKDSGCGYACLDDVSSVEASNSSAL
jgi:hypothetical protein